MNTTNTENRENTENTNNRNRLSHTLANSAIFVTSQSKMFLDFMVVAAINDVVRRVINFTMDSILSVFTVSVEIPIDDEAYKYVAEWLEVQPFVQKSRELIVRTNRARPNRLMFLPGKGTHLFWYKNRPTWFARFNSLSGGSYKPELRITMFGRDTGHIKNFVSETMKYALRNELGKVIVSSNDTNNLWITFGPPRNPRDPKTLVLPGNLFEEIKHDCHRFLNNEEWYAQRGIPYRRGYLFYGTPGSGKSSLTEVLAGSLGLNVCILTLTLPSLTDQSLALLLNTAPINSIILLEDIDASFVDRQSTSAPKPPNHITFSGLLNALDGVAAQGGRILVMTTNHIDVLDPALIRDGRVDRKVKFENAIQEQARRLFAHFYDIPEDDPQCQQFASALPDYHASMARLQGHLVLNRTPQEALASLPELLQK